MAASSGEIIQHLGREVDLGQAEADPSAQSCGDLHVEKVRHVEVGIVA